MTSDVVIGLEIVGDQAIAAMNYLAGPENPA